MVESQKPQTVIIENFPVTSINYHGKILFSFSDLGDAFEINTRDRPFQLQMKTLERGGKVKSIPIKGMRKNVRMLAFEEFKEIITKAMQDEIRGEKYSKEDAEKILVAIKKYAQELPK
jgi:hypothetical protein